MNFELYLTGILGYNIYIHPLVASAAFLCTTFLLFVNFRTDLKVVETAAADHKDERHARLALAKFEIAADLEDCCGDCEVDGMGA